MGLAVRHIYQVNGAQKIAGKRPDRCRLNRPPTSSPLCPTVPTSAGEPRESSRHRPDGLLPGTVASIEWPARTTASPRPGDSTGAGPWQERTTRTRDMPRMSSRPPVSAGRCPSTARPPGRNDRRGTGRRLVRSGRGNRLRQRVSSLARLRRPRRTNRQPTSDSRRTSRLPNWQRWDPPSCQSDSAAPHRPAGSRRCSLRRAGPAPVRTSREQLGLAAARSLS